MNYVNKVVLNGNEVQLNSLEGLQDAQGHNRFIEGDGNVSQTQTGLTSTYCKWSLSGTHLMLVLAGYFADTTQIADSTIAKFSIPTWILDKIYPTYSTHIEDKTIKAYNDDASSTQNFEFALTKLSDGLYLIPNSLTTMTDKRNFRAQFDLLIDND